MVLAVLLAIGVNAFAVGQIKSGTTTIRNADLTVTGATPFANDGVANLVTDVYALILTKVKPSAALGLLADHVQIKGEEAVNGENCQVKMYGQGCIILPYGDDTKPLTVYSEPNFSGDESDDFDLRDSGGFMNSLTDDQLNNRIRSFKLKRGYMVTFSLRPGGYGYSRCFIAADKDLEVNELPELMDRKISSYRIFKWYDASKKGLADAAHEKAICDALNVTTTYEWWKGRDAALAPDVECVPHHYKESWPTAGGCGQVTTSPHLKMNNEPKNPADEESCELSDILGNWEQFMRTGHRLCSPSSWDGSDYSNGTGFLKEFFDEIDKRGWRCDIVDLHGYWLLENFKSYLPNWNKAVGRPIWVTEFVWGASWGNNNNGTGAFVSGVTDEQNATKVREICEYMNGLDYVERYYFWNAERVPSKVYNGGLTEAGKYYASLDPGLAYKGATNYVPAGPPTSAPTNLMCYYFEDTGKTQLTWKEQNGELSTSMVVERSGNGSSWEEVATVDLKESAANYSLDIDDGPAGCQYRIRVTDYKGNNLTSNVVTVKASLKVYLYNIGAREWLTSGNDWGTHASLTENGGHDVILQKSGEGKYTIETMIRRDDTNHFLNVDGKGMPYVDQPSGVWTLTSVGTQDGQPVYRLSIGGKNLAYDGSTSALVCNSETGANAQWMLLSYDDRMAMLERATEAAPQDATFLLPGANFHQYDQRNGSWEGGPKIGGTNTNMNAEKYNCTFDVFQIIEGAPAGNYRLQAQAFYRNGGYNDKDNSTAGAAHLNGTEQLNALLYANEETVPVVSIFSDAGKVDAGVTYNGISGKFPNGMGEASTFFSGGCYENTLEFSLEEGQELRIGIKKEETTANDWTIFDNFRLVYLGPTIVPNDVNGDTEVDANDVNDLISYLLGDTTVNINFEAADIYVDGEVNIKDVTKLINIILEGQQRSLPASSGQTTGEASSKRTRE